MTGSGLALLEPAGAATRDETFKPLWRVAEVCIACFSSNAPVSNAVMIFALSLLIAGGASAGASGKILPQG